MTLEVGLDYSQGIFRCRTQTDFEEWLESCAHFCQSTWGYISQTGFSESCRVLRFKSPSGFYGTLNQDDNATFRGHVFFPGAFFSHLSIRSQQRFVTFLLESDFRFTRLDIRCDDYLRRVCFDEVRRAGETANYALVDSYKCVESGFKGFDGTIPTCYFGSSDKILRFYNAEFVHGVLADRWELQLRDEYSRVVALDFSKDISILFPTLIGSVDFIDKSSGKRRDRCNRLDWWQSFYDTSEVHHPQLDQYVPNLQRMLQWLDRQVAVSLAVLKQGLGDNFDTYLARLCDRGHSRFSDYHEQWVKDLQSRRVNIDVY